MSKGDETMETQHLGRLEINLYSRGGKTLKETGIKLPKTEDKVFDNEVLKMFVAELEVIKTDLTLKILRNIREPEF